MKNLAIVLRILAPVSIVVAALHIVFGVGADVLLGAAVPPTMQTEPSLSSQNRFYGTSFALYGAVLYLCSQDLQTYERLFKVVMWAFFAAGLARLIPWIQYGPPAPLLVMLLVIELLLPPALLFWHARARTEA